MAPKDFVVSADGHLLEPTDLFKTRLPKHLRDRAVWEEDFEIEPFVEGGARHFRRLHTAGYEGWTISRYRQTSGRTPEGDPELILEDMELDGVDVQVMHPNLSLFGLYSDDHELSIAHARVYNDYVVERFSPYFDRHLSDGARPALRRGRRRRRDRAGGGRGLPHRPAAGHPAAQLLHPGPRPGLGRAAGDGPPAVLPHPDRRGERPRHRGHDPQGRPGERRSGQPADDRAGRGQAHGHPGRVQHARPVAAHLPAHRGRCRRALPRPPLLADRVQRPLAGIARRRHGQVLGHGHRPGRRLVARQVGRHPPHRRPAGHGPAVPAQREVAVPPHPERVRAPPVPRPVPGRPGRHRVPPHHRPVHPRLGQRLPARRGHVPRQPASSTPRSSPGSPTTSGGRSSAARWAACSASPLRSRPDPAPTS